MGHPVRRPTAVGQATNIHSPPVGRGRLPGPTGLRPAAASIRATPAVGRRSGLHLGDPTVEMNVGGGCCDAESRTFRRCRRLAGRSIPRDQPHTGAAALLGVLLAPLNPCGDLHRRRRDRATGLGDVPLGPQSA